MFFTFLACMPVLGLIGWLAGGWCLAWYVVSVLSALKRCDDDDGLAFLCVERFAGVGRSVCLGVWFWMELEVR